MAKTPATPPASPPVTAETAAPTAAGPASTEPPAGPTPFIAADAGVLMVKDRTTGRIESYLAPNVPTLETWVAHGYSAENYNEAKLRSEAQRLFSPRPDSAREASGGDTRRWNIGALPHFGPQNPGEHHQRLDPGSIVTLAADGKPGPGWFDADVPGAPPTPFVKRTAEQVHVRAADKSSPRG